MKRSTKKHSFVNLIRGKKARNINYKQISAKLHTHQQQLSTCPLALAATNSLLLSATHETAKQQKKQ